MKILHVVTLVSPDGAFGGPTRVAANLCAALREKGHDAVIAAGVIGFDEPPTEIDGVPAHLFPAKLLIRGLGHAPTYAPGLRRWLDVHAAKFDIVHVHLARDMVTLPAALTLRRMRIPFVLQTHGMIAPQTRSMVFPRSHPLMAPIDKLWTAKLLRSADRIFYLTSAERHNLCAVGGPGLPLRELRNGVPTPAIAATQPAAVPEVLFLARLHERKMPEVFAEAALSLLRSGVRGRFAIVGPPGGAESDVDDIIAQARSDGFGEDSIRREPAVEPEQAGQRMSQAAVYVLPSWGEPMAMTVLEAMMLGVPVIVRSDNGLAPFIANHDCGVVVDGGPENFAQAMSDLLSDPARARDMGERGRVATESNFGIAAVGREVEEAYRRVVYGDKE